uniref:Uncharacterized protein n=1 Tax=Arundo donax TaxID=35708 RepID=A0A0A9GTT0_ARUDO
MQWRYRKEQYKLILEQKMTEKKERTEDNLEMDQIPSK